MSVVKFLGKDSGFDAETTLLLGTAFDSAWATVQASGSQLGSASQAPLIRELLAKHILEMGLAGERNPDRLVENALGRLANIQSADANPATAQTA